LRIGESNEPAVDIPLHEERLLFILQTVPKS
jgi:hypothetical protein